MKRVLLSWSSGKDSAWALHLLRRDPEVEVCGLLTTLNAEFDHAAAALKKALALGYRDFKWIAHDPDLRHLRKHPLYRTIRDKIRKMKIKVT